MESRNAMGSSVLQEWLQKMRVKEMDDERTVLSKKLSYVLRHGAKELGLAVNAEGYVDVSELLGLEVLFGGVTEEALLEFVEQSNQDKQRYEVKKDGDELLIRATGKHTMQGLENQKKEARERRREDASGSRRGGFGGGGREAPPVRQISEEDFCTRWKLDKFAKARLNELPAEIRQTAMAQFNPPPQVPSSDYPKVFVAFCKRFRGMKGKDESNSGGWHDSGWNDDSYADDGRGWYGEGWRSSDRRDNRDNTVGWRSGKHASKDRESNPVSSRNGVSDRPAPGEFEGSGRPDYAVYASPGASPRGQVPDGAGSGRYPPSHVPSQHYPGTAMTQHLGTQPPPPPPPPPPPAHAPQVVQPCYDRHPAPAGDRGLASTTVARSGCDGGDGGYQVVQPCYDRHPAPAGDRGLASTTTARSGCEMGDGGYQGALSYGPPSSQPHYNAPPPPRSVGGRPNAANPGGVARELREREEMYHQQMMQQQRQHVMSHQSETSYSTVPIMRQGYSHSDYQQHQYSHSEHQQHHYDYGGYNYGHQGYYAPMEQYGYS